MAENDRIIEPRSIDSQNQINDIENMTVNTKTQHIIMKENMTAGDRNFIPEYRNINSRPIINIESPVVRLLGSINSLNDIAMLFHLRS